MRHYVVGTGRARDVEPDDPADVLAMQMVLRIEKSTPPARADLLIAAARAVTLLCLDERAGGDGPWSAPMDAWCNARIRKIARRARASHWQAAQEVWGVTAVTNGVSARALVPGRVGDVDPRIKRLQIGGTEVAGDLPDAPTGTAGVLVLWINPGLEMTVGKTAAQVGHGAMLGVALMSGDRAQSWYDADCPIEVCAADDPTWTELLAAAGDARTVAVRDAGFTEIEPGSVTVIARFGSP